MMYVDLDELPSLFERYWLWSVTKPALARFRRDKHTGTGDLKSAVRDLLQSKLSSGWPHQIADQLLLLRLLVQSGQLLLLFCR